MILIKNHFSVYIFSACGHFSPRLLAVISASDNSHPMNTPVTSLALAWLINGHAFFVSPQILVICRCIYYPEFAIRLVFLDSSWSSLKMYKVELKRLSPNALHLACFSLELILRNEMHLFVRMMRSAFHPGIEFKMN